MLKKSCYLLFLLIAITSCKSSKPAIVTSKKDSSKKGKYEGNLNIRLTKNDSRKSTGKQENVVINSSNNLITCDDSELLIDLLINASIDNIGSPYRYGGTTKSGFDCSGLLYTTFKNHNIILPRTSSEMSKVGKDIRLSNAKKGDLIFFSTNGKGTINHVGLIVDVKNDDVQFVHSSTQKGVIVSSTKEAYYKKAYISARRIIE
jgi:murein DD-endopeptidase / murein LD-carboxypeptidase